MSRQEKLQKFELLRTPWGRDKHEALFLASNLMWWPLIG